MKDVGVDGMELVAVKTVFQETRTFLGRRVGNFVVIYAPNDGATAQLRSNGRVIRLAPFRIIDDVSGLVCTHASTADEAWIIADDLSRFVPDGFSTPGTQKLDPNSIIAQWLRSCFEQTSSLRDWCKKNGFPDPVGTIKVPDARNEIAAIAKGIY